MTLEEFAYSFTRWNITGKSALDHSLILVIPLTFSRARIVISRPSSWMYDVYDDGW